MTREQFISLFFIGLLLFVVHEIFLIFSPFVQAIFWSGILAFGFYPLYQKLKERWITQEMVASLVMTVLIFLIVLPPVLLVLVNVAAQAIQLYHDASSYVREGQLEKLIDQIRAVPFIQNAETRLFQWEPVKESITAWILSTARAIGNFATGQVGTITKNIFTSALNILLMSFLLFVFLKDGEKIYQFIYEIAPLEKKNKRAIFSQINDTFAAVIRGQLLTSLTQAVVAGFIFWILRLPLPVFFAAVTFITSMIPVAGAAAVWLPLVVYLITLGQYHRAVILFVLGAFVISLIDNLMKPALIGEKTKLPYFLLFFGILGGIKLYGLMGIFIAPVVLSLFFALVKIYQEKDL